MTNPQTKKNMKRMTFFESEQFHREFGTIRLEKWPEGIVLWAGGEIRWKSWK